MTLAKIRDRFSGATAALTLTAILSVSAAQDARADTSVPLSFDDLGMCNEYEITDEGVELGAFGSAIQYSEAKDNDVAVVVYTGGGAITPDMALRGAEKMASLIRDEGFNARCFVGAHDPHKGTSYIFLVNGRPVPETKGLDIEEAVAQLKHVKTEARLVREAGIKGKSEYLIAASLSAE